MANLNSIAKKLQKAILQKRASYKDGDKSVLFRRAK